jgi:hypothetical protein
VVIQTEGKKGWFWYIPLHDDIVSVASSPTTTTSSRTASRRSLKTYDFEEVENCPA